MPPAPLTRAYAVLHVKAVDGERRRITGMATTPEPDRMGDVVESLGITFKNPVPLLLYHDPRKPVGKVWFDAPTADGLAFEAELPEVTTPGTLRDRIEEAWDSLKTGLLGGVSIGFRSLEPEAFDKKTQGFRFSRTEVLELSLVTIPANAGATVHMIKALDQAASGLTPPGVSGPAPVHALKQARPMENQIHDQISAFEATRQAKAARMQTLMTTAAGEHVTLDQAQSEEYDALEREVGDVDAHLVRLRKLEKQNIVGATRVEPAAGLTPAAASAARGAAPHVVQVRSLLPKGIEFVRMVCAKHVCNGNRLEAAQYAEERWKDTPNVALALKAAVAAGTTTDATWAAPLVQAGITAEFVELLRPQLIIGKIQGLRKVPFNTPVPAQTAGGTYGWVGQAKAKPVTKLAFSSDILPVTKAAGIIVITDELAKLSSPSAEALVRDDLIKGIAQFVDGQFIDPAVAAVAGVNPASITNGLTPIVSSDDPMTDLVTIFQAFAAAGVSLGGLTLIMSESNALVMGLIRDAQGNPLFPGVGAQGGSTQGVTVVTSSTAGTNVIALQPAYVLLADEGQVNVDVSREASLQMDSAPANPADATTVLVSLWQHNMVGLRGEWFINYKRILPAAVQLVSGAVYAPLLVTPAAARGGAAQAGRRTPPEPARAEKA